MEAQSLVAGVALLGFALAALSLFAGLFFMVDLFFGAKSEQEEEA